MGAKVTKSKEKIYRKSEVESNWYKNKYYELAYFAFNYLFTIFGLPTQENSELIYQEDENERDDSFDQDVEDLSLIIAPMKKHIFSFKCERKLDEVEKDIGKMIIEEFCQISKHKYYKSGIQYNYGDNLSVADNNYKYAVESGICSWIVGERIRGKNNKIGELFRHLEMWSVKTYEGRKVTFGFLLNKKIIKNDGFDYVSFVKDDYAATITDCINSVVEIDRNGKLIQYHSITQNNKINGVEIDAKVPYRFAHVLKEYVNGDRIGIFLLNNGDLVISDDGAIRFVKRNLHWLNLSYEGFNRALTDAEFDMPDELKKPIYGSMLDVSFSHTGGIIAVVEKIEELKEPEDILANVDDLKHPYDPGKEDEQISQELKSKKQNGKDIKKRISKRTVLKSLLDANSKDYRFDEIDRKLRAELIAMDGACIIEKNGIVHSFGAIIQNDSGSSGGGRGAACKKLSKYGMAIKISTDGYIEMYVRGKEIYVVK